VADQGDHATIGILLMLIQAIAEFFKDMAAARGSR
jgi:hypothetical protein